ncbi:MAG: SDR family oxidoreductase [Bdellovibrionales bacterium]|nr:SDR family oxidoreductase [Bdellovibrionales bacterium]
MPQTVLVTGATDGIGLETAKQLARRGFRVMVHGRNPKRLETCLHEIRSAAPGTELEPWLADFGSLDQVRKMGESIVQSGSKLDAVIHNAGVFMNQYEETQDGFETTFQVNHLAPFLLTCALRESLNPTARIIVVSSIAHWRGQMNWKDLNLKNGFTAYGAYAASKLCNVLFVNELHRRNQGTPLQAYSLHPGVISTKLLRAGFSVVGSRVEEGAQTSVYLASENLDPAWNGEYFVDSKVAEKSPNAQSPEFAERLWEKSVSLTGADWPPKS